MSEPRKAIIGVGNVLLSDEGVGVHAARHLLTRQLPEDVLVLDGGTEGLGLMDAIVGLQRLVVIDAVRGGGEPGTVYCFDWEQLQPGIGPRPMTTAHQVSLADVFTHVSLVAEVPRTSIVGVEPATLDHSLTLSAGVQAQLDRVCDLSLAQIELP